MDIKDIIAKMTTEEKAALVSGTDFMFTNPVPRVGIPSMRTSDGPHGLRVQNGGGDNGVTGRARNGISHRSDDRLRLERGKFI